MGHAHPPALHFRRLVYTLAVSIGVSFGAILYGTSVLITSEAAGAEFSVSLLSTAFSGSVLTGAAVAVHVGRYADRHGIRAVLAFGGLLVFLGFLGFAASSSEWQVLAAWWVLIGPGSAMVLFEPAFIAIQQWFSRESRNRAAGTLTLITGLAGPVFVPSTTYVVDILGWRATAALLGASVLLACSATAGWALRVAPGGTALPQSPAKDPDDDAARFLLPVLANRFDPAKLYITVTLLIMPAVWLAVRGSAVWEMNGHFILFGLLFGAFIPLRAVMMSDWYSGPQFGALMGLQAIAIALGRAAGPVSVGWLADTPVGYPGAMTLLSMLLLLSLALLLVALNRRQQH